MNRYFISLLLVCMLGGCARPSQFEDQWINPVHMTESHLLADQASCLEESVSDGEVIEDWFTSCMEDRYWRLIKVEVLEEEE